MARERISIRATKDIIVVNGNQIKMYSDAESTQTYAINGSTGAVTVGSDGSGADATWYGATSGTYMQWDASANSLLIPGTAGKFQVGAFSGSTHGSGSVVSASYTAPLKVFADDGNAAIGSGSLVRAGWFRNLQVYTGGNREQEAAGVQGSIVSVGGTNRHNMCGVLGSYEARTSLTVDGQAAATDTWCQAGVIGRVGMSSGTLTLNSNGVLAGVAAMSNINTAVTQTYTGAYTGLYVGAWASTDDWGYGLYIEQDKISTAGIYIGSGATRALDSQGKGRFGTHDWGVGATGILLNGTDPDMAFEVGARINAALAAGAYSAEYNQLACTAAQTGNVSSFASWNELYFTGTTAIGTGNAAAVWGHIEISGTFTGPASTSNYMGSVVGSLMSDAATVTNSGIMGAFVADSVLTTGFTNNATIAAFVAHVNASHPTRANWPVALYVNGADVVFGFGSGTNYEDGIKIVDGVAGDTGSEGTVGYDALLKCDVGGTAYYIPMFDAGSVTNE